uniref:Ras-related protein Rab n=2 Tax=Clastoptera arizonana TaxID=38151 RepID=A0A1B6C360_9HEMI
MTRVYYKYAVAAALVFDLTRLGTFHNMLKWLQDLREKVTLNDGSPIPIIILATKCDIKEDHVSPDLINRFCKENSIKAWFTTSAKDDINIDEAIDYLIEQCIELSPQVSHRGSLIIDDERTNSWIKRIICCDF